jgi:hypothetical protein
MTNHRLITGVDFVVVPTDAFAEAVAFYGKGAQSSVHQPLRHRSRC